MMIALCQVSLKNGLSIQELSYIIVHQSAIFTYAALTVSGVLLIFVLLYVIISKIIVKCYKLGCKRKGQYFLLSTRDRDQSE